MQIAGMRESNAALDLATLAQEVLSRQLGRLMSHFFSCSNNHEVPASFRLDFELKPSLPGPNA